ncbi:MAG: sporulation inhibitor of replication protein SirA [Ectobacillus sp.]
MKTYYLYLIDDDIAKKYYGRGFMLFDLFSRFVNSHSLTEKKILYKQIQYVTKPLQTLRLHHRIGYGLACRGDYKREKDMHFLRLESGETGKLTIKKRYVKIETDGSFEVETTFFEILRKNELTFLAMNYESNQCGWLNPLKKERRYV